MFVGGFLACLATASIPFGSARYPSEEIICPNTSLHDETVDIFLALSSHCFPSISPELCLNDPDVH